jgi:hypothetical protein
VCWVRLRRGERTESLTLTSLGRRTVRKLRLRGLMAVRRRLWTEGCTIGPPAESESASGRKSQPLEQLGVRVGAVAYMRLSLLESRAGSHRR